MAVTSTLDGKYGELKKVGGKSKVVNSAFSRCQDVSRNSTSFSSSNVVAEYINPRGTALAFEREKARIVSGLTIFRNILTLIPLAITWWGFLQISREPNLDLAKALRDFTGIALADLVCFGLLILIGLLADARSDSARRAALRIQEILDGIVHELTRRPTAPRADLGNIEQWTQLVQDQLQAVRELLNDVSAEIKVTTATTKEVANQMLALQQAALALGREASTLSGAVAGIDASASQMAKSAQGMDASSKALTAATAAAAAAQDATNRKMDTVVQDLDRTSRAIEAAAASEASIPTALGQVSGNMTRASKIIADTEKQLKGVADHLARLMYAAGGMHSVWWKMLPWNWGRGGPTVSASQQQAYQQQQVYQQQQAYQQQQQAYQQGPGGQPGMGPMPPGGQPQPNTQNMPPNTQP